MSSDTIPLPVTAVTCLEDRSQVERAVTVDLAAGVQRLRLGPITALAVDRTLRAEATGLVPADTESPGVAGPRLLDARIVRAWTPRAPLAPGPDDSALRHRVHELDVRARQEDQLRHR
ncbi:DUF4140 domain-containing protein, partial [Kitasatospora sp. NPDC058263]